MEEPYTQLYSDGDYLVLELYDGDIFEGYFVSGGKNRIDLDNVKQHNNPNDSLSGIFSFYRNEIQNVRKLKSKPTKKVVTQDPDEAEKIKIDQDEYLRLRELTKTFIYLENADKRFFDAIEHLKESETIAVASLGLEENRSAVLRLLAISTWKQVYLFDMIGVKHTQFYPELKEILESEYTCKIFHNGAPLVDILYRKYNVFCQNIFDTQIVDLIIEKNKGGAKALEKIRALPECLNHYLNFPKCILQDACAVTRKEWCERPLDPQVRIYAAQFVTYLIPLKERLQAILLSETHKAISNVYDYYYKLDDYEFAQKFNCMKLDDKVDKLIPKLTRNFVGGLQESASNGT